MNIKSLHLYAILFLTTTAFQMNLLAAESSDINNSDSSQMLTAIDSPLLDADLERPHVILNILAYQPDLFLYPIKITEINGYAINESEQNYEYHLATGQYQIVVEPNFSTLNQQKFFMAQSWAAKRLMLDIKSNGVYMIGARLDDVDKKEWRAEIYQLQEALIPDNKQANSN